MDLRTVVLVLSATAAWAAAPQLRLDHSARPTRYTLDLTLIPEQDDFSGKIDIALQLNLPTSEIWLNATGLTIDEARLATAGWAVDGKAESGGKDFAKVVLSSSVPAGPATLHLAFHGLLNKKSSAGLFKVREGNDWYVFSQFEAIDARRAFPCFDEPAFKVPWEITLHVNKEHVALGNMPVVSETDEPNGRKAVRFSASPPLPSYLIAMAVGPLEFVDAGRTAGKGTRVRIVTARGKTREARYAAEVSATILDRLETYFGSPYPYPKLDLAAVPLMGGAMENAGLVTFNQTMILADPARDSIARQREYASVCAHELAHQWFGDLVTMEWWDDTWLNEAFATWTASKILSEWKPEWGTRLSDVQSRLGAMREDSLVSARKVRQPIESTDDIANAFDGITYEKGAAVIRMFESWMGEEAFQKGVRRYLLQFAWKNAKVGDFLDALSASSKRDVSSPFSTFLEQAGVPLVSVEVECGHGGSRLKLTQKRALPVGSSGSSDQIWRIPVCFRYEAHGEIHRECTLLTASAAEWKLKSKACPAWIAANADASGYYHVAYQGDLLRPLVAGGGKQLTEPERAMLLGDMAALMEAGAVKAGDALALVPVFGRDQPRQILVAAARIGIAAQAHLVPDDLRPNYARFVRRVFGDRARQLGWQPKPGEDDDTRLSRKFLTVYVATKGEDTELGSEARRLADRWLEDRKAVDPNLTAEVLQTAAANGDRALFDRYLSAAKATMDRREREYLLGAMGSFHDPAIVRAALQLLLTGAFDFREAEVLLFYPRGYPATRTLPFDFVKANYDALLKIIPREGAFDAAASLPFTASAFCDERSGTEVQAFFASRFSTVTGGPRNLAQALESIRLCEALVKAQQPSAAEFLQGY